MTAANPPRGGAVDPVRALVRRALSLADRAFGTSSGRPGPGASPVAAYAPARVNLIGDHTDYQGGLALPMALETGIAAIVRQRPDSWIGLVSEGRGGPVWIHRDRLRVWPAMPPEGWDGAEAGPARAIGTDVPVWAAFLAGVLVEAGAGDGEGLEIAVVSDVPEGQGLSSSAAVGLAVALAGHPDLAGRSALTDARRLSLCLAVQRAEHRDLGVPSGILDELASAFGRAGCALRVDAARVEAQPVPFAPEADGYGIFLIDLGVGRSLAGSGYAARRREVEEAARLLGIPALGMLPVTDLPQALSRVPDRLKGRVRHVVTENERVRSAIRTASLRRWEEVGALMAESHRSLRDDYASSHPVLDRAAGRLLDMTPPIFARVTGGGFGGNLVALGPGGPDVPDALVRHLAGLAGAQSPCQVRVVRAGPGLMAVSDLQG